MCSEGACYVLLNELSNNSLANKKLLGYLAAIITVSIWATFLVGTRFAITKDFTVEEILILRLLPAALIMAPLMFKFGILPPGDYFITKIIFALGASALFPWILSMGLYYAPASNAGALAPGTLPFWTALIATRRIGRAAGYWLFSTEWTRRWSCRAC